MPYAMKPVRLLVLALLSCLVALAVLTVAPKRALAGGNFTVKTTEVTESQGEWHVKVRIDMTRAPGMMHIPMRFTFSKDAVDERAIMTRGADPVHHRNVLDVSPKQIQSMDVDFADPTGKVFKSTYFEFDLRRDGGYFEAGEYQVSLSGPDGDVGDTPPVYRGAMDFTDPKAAKKGPKIQSVDNGVDAGAKVAANDDSSSNGSGPSGGVQAVGNGGSMVPASAFDKTSEEEAVHGNAKGCGCVAAGLEGGTFAGGVGALLGLALVVARRRR